jgi:hypothetical protein
MLRADIQEKPMTSIRALLLAAAGVAIGATVPQTASAQCYGYGCSPGAMRPYYHASDWYRGAIPAYQAQAYFPNIGVYGDASGLYAYGYAAGYRSAYGCLWLDRNCPSW